MARDSSPTASANGSPPRAWGTWGHGPATVGPDSVHPHVRGEHGRGTKMIQPPAGSPPRAWGTCGDGGDLIQRLARFTPTCVGNMFLPIVSGCRLSGSPPRAWGTFAYGPPAYRERRFTPTCVGNIRPTASTSMALAVHPHVRGEHFTNRSVNGSPGGSPPRAWGTCWAFLLRWDGRWFTPTCVGNIACLH